MNRGFYMLALGCCLLALSSCGPLGRLRARRAAVSDSAIQVFAPVPDSGIVRADSPRIFGPFVDSGAVAQVSQMPGRSADTGLTPAWWEAPYTYSTFSGKAKAHYESPEENRDFTLNVRVESGKRIWMSVVGSALGVSVEAFRAVLTPDSMIAIDRFAKEVIRAPFGDILNLFPVQGDFHSLEAVLVGSRLPAAPVLHRILPDTLDGMIHVMGTFAAGTQWIDFRESDSIMIRQTLETGESAMELHYDAYQPAGERKFAEKRGLILESASGWQKLDLDYSSFSFDQPVDMTLTIPEKYKQR